MTRVFWNVRLRELLERGMFPRPPAWCLERQPLVTSPCPRNSSTYMDTGDNGMHGLWTTSQSFPTVPNSNSHLDGGRESYSPERLRHMVVARRSFASMQSALYSFFCLVPIKYQWDFQSTSSLQREMVRPIRKKLHTLEIRVRHAMRGKDKDAEQSRATHETLLIFLMIHGQ